jgi:hypothetical protein
MSSTFRLTFRNTFNDDNLMKCQIRMFVLQDLELIISIGICHGANSLNEERVHILRLSSNKAHAN